MSNKVSRIMNGNVNTVLGQESVETLPITGPRIEKLQITDIWLFRVRRVSIKLIL